MMTNTKKYNVNIYYTGFCTYEVQAENESEAILKARTLPIKQAEILTNIDNWEEADLAFEL